MKAILLIVLITFLSGCSMFVPPSGTHYTVKYGEIEVEVDDYTDRNGVQFEYTNGDTKVVLKKKEVDTATPAAAISQKQAENNSKLLDAVAAIIPRLGV